MIGHGDSTGAPEQMSSTGGMFPLGPVQEGLFQLDFISTGQYIPITVTFSLYHKDNLNENFVKYS